MPTRKLRQAFVLAALTLFAGCQKSLPTTPADLSSGIVIFEHANYMGASAHVTEDVKNLEDVKGPCIKTESSGTGATSSKDVWGDCISSIRVASGWRATIYRDDGYSGDRLDVTADVPNLQLVSGDCSKGGFNDCVSSIRLIRP
jgi:hypothetical protein